MTADGNLQPITNWTEEMAAAVASIEVVRRSGTDTEHWRGVIFRLPARVAIGADLQGDQDREACEREQDDRDRFVFLVGRL